MTTRSNNAKQGLTLRAGSTDEGAPGGPGRIRRALSYVLPHWRFLLLIPALTIVLVATGAAQPWPMKVLVDNVLADAGSTDLIEQIGAFLGAEISTSMVIVFAGLATIGLFIVSSAVSFILALCWNILGQRTVYALSADLLAHLQKLSLQFHSRTSVGDSLNRLSDDTWALVALLDSALVTPIQQVFSILLLGSIAITLDPILGIVTLVTAPLMALSAAFFGKRIKRRSKLKQEAKAKITSLVHQTLGALPAVQAFDRERTQDDQFEKLADEAIWLTQRGNLLGNTFTLVNGVIISLGSATVLYVGSLRVLSDAISVGTLLVFMAYVRKLQSSTNGLFKLYVKVKKAEASIDRVMEVMEAKDLIEEDPDAIEMGHSGASASVHVKLDEVSFSYVEGEPTLRNINMEARPGQVVALVGPTGSGKSTIAALIPRLIDPVSGRVLINGVDSRHLKIASLRASVSLVLQDDLLLPISIRDNIAYGRPEAGEEDVIAAAISAGAHDFIRALPNGYETIVSERGANLSGGQRQRISIARALVKNAPVLILDEPTSALDPHTEADFVRAMETLMKGRTTFIIAHRLSTIRSADRIYVLQKGEIVEDGTEQELVDKGGLYYLMFEQQSAIKVEEPKA